MERTTATFSSIAVVVGFAFMGFICHNAYQDNIHDKELIKVCIEAKGEPIFTAEGEKATGFFRGCDLPNG